MKSRIRRGNCHITDRRIKFGSPVEIACHDVAVMRGVQFQAVNEVALLDAPGGGVGGGAVPDYCYSHVLFSRNKKE